MVALFDIAKAFFPDAPPLRTFDDLVNAWRQNGYDARVVDVQGISAVVIAQEVSLEQADRLISHFDQSLSKSSESHTPWATSARYAGQGAEITLDLHESSGLPPYLQLTMRVAA